jgi:hypothetical protein
MSQIKAQNFSGQRYSRLHDPSTQETVDIHGAKIKLIENFDGAIVNTDKWTEEVAAGGLAALVLGKPGYTLAVAAETQDAGIHAVDVRFNIDKGVIFETRLAVSVLPTITSELLIGLQADAFASGSNLVAGADEVNKHALFVLNGAVSTGKDLVIYNDDGADEHNGTDTAIDITAGATSFKVYRVDATNSASVKFYVDGVRVCPTTTFKMSTTANLLMMPIVCLVKNGANAGLGAFYLDYIKVWQLER